jgi:hypothetical protein
VRRYTAAPSSRFTVCTLATPGAGRGGGALHSFGVTNPGAVTLHNRPRPMQDFRRMGTHVISVQGARGVLRYSEFRCLLRLRLDRTQHSMMSVAAMMRRSINCAVYGDVIDKVDTTVGMLGERARSDSTPATPPFGSSSFGLAPAQERQALHRRLHAEFLYTRGHGLARRTRHRLGPDAALSRSRRHPPPPTKCVRAVASSRLTASAH